MTEQETRLYQDPIADDPLPVVELRPSLKIGLLLLTIGALVATIVRAL